MTTGEILDALLPYTPEERKCGQKKKRKLNQRYELVIQINNYRKGKELKIDKLNVNKERLLQLLEK